MPPKIQVLKAVHALSADRFAMGDSLMSSSLGLSQLPDTVDEFSHELLFCSEIEVSNCSPPVAFLPHTVFDSSKSQGFDKEKQRFIHSVSVSYSESDSIDHNCEWDVTFLDASDFDAEEVV